MAQLGDTVITGSLAVSNNIYGSVTCATNSTCFSGCTYACAKADFRNYTPSSASNATCFGGCTYACAKADFRNYTPSCATNACYACASYHVYDLNDSTKDIYLAYTGTGLTCAQITHLAGFSTNYSTGKTIIKDAPKTSVQSWLGLGDSAYKGVYGLTAKGDIGWGTEANKSKVVQVCAMAYWNGAYQGTSSNLTYFCGGTFGSAAACSATCFLGATSKACCASWADKIRTDGSSATYSAYVGANSSSNAICLLGCYNNTTGVNVHVFYATNACSANSSSAITKCSNAICIYAKKVNYSCSYWLCNRCKFDVLFAPIVNTVNDCHMEYSTIKKFMGTIIPANAECWVGTFDSCIGTWNTCYPGIRVS